MAGVSFFYVSVAPNKIRPLSQFTVQYVGVYVGLVLVLVRPAHAVTSLRRTDTTIYGKRNVKQLCFLVGQQNGRTMPEVC